jgi:hypothetical protein
MMLNEEHTHTHALSLSLCSVDCMCSAVSAGRRCTTTTTTTTTSNLFLGRLGNKPGTPGQRERAVKAMMGARLIAGLIARLVQPCSWLLRCTRLAARFGERLQ